MLARARAATSLEHFGEDSFREGLDILVASADAEARFTDLGRAAFDGQVIGLLANRLQVEHWHRAHPEIDEQEIVAPLIGLGLPRTGSTALSCLLAEDRAARVMRVWESMRPCPPPEAETQDSDPRIAEAAMAMAQSDVLFPRLRQMLPSTPTGPMECQQLMGFDFKTQMFQASAHIPSYCAWLYDKADLVPTYRYVKRVLKLLQWRCPPKRWRLKNPSHSLFIGALNVVFPDARFWMTHRDVASVVPSVADLYFEMRRAFTDHVDKPDLGRHAAEFCEIGMRRMIAFRDAGNDHRFFDIHFEPFQKDPLASVSALYAFLGEDFTPPARSRMEAWRRASPREQHGGHSYEAGEFGIDAPSLRERFRFYSDRFDIPTSQAAA